MMTNYSRDSHIRDPKFFGESGSARTNTSVFFSYVFHLFFCEFCPTTINPLCLSILRYFILRVFGVSAKEKMRGIYTRWIVTTMKNVYPFWDLPKSQKIRKPMGRPSYRRGELTVSESSFTTHPQNTPFLSCFSDMFQKPLFGCASSRFIGTSHRAVFATSPFGQTSMGVEHFATISAFIFYHLMIVTRFMWICNQIVVG